MADETQDRGPEFDRVRIGRPATGALIDAGYEKLSDLPERMTGGASSRVASTRDPIVSAVP